MLLDLILHKPVCGSHPRTGEEFSPMNTFHFIKTLQRWARHKTRKTSLADPKPVAQFRGG
jgi:hypothetical protein